MKQLTEDKLQQVIREELLKEFNVVPATSDEELKRFVNNYIGGVDASGVEAVDAVGDRWTIMLDSDQTFELNIQSWKYAEVVSVMSRGGRIELTIEL